MTQRSLPNPLNQLRLLHAAHVDCLATRLRKEGCSAQPPPSSVCIDCDSCPVFPEQSTRPDYVVLAATPEGEVWHVVEMKGRVSSASRVVQQLQAGASIIEESPPFAVSLDADLSPTVLHDGGLRVADFQSKAVRFRGTPKRIRWLRCGSQL